MLQGMEKLDHLETEVLMEETIIKRKESITRCIALF